MFFDKEIQLYLSGHRFSNALFVPISKPELKVVYRIDYIIDCTKNTKVIHLGCADHVELIKLKISQGNWLHGQLEKYAEACIGVDIDKEAIQFIKELGIKNTMVLDVTKDPPPPEIAQEHWDYMVLGELLEHIDNPISFLRELHSKYAQNVKKLIISVPSAFRILNFRKAWKHGELINSDHRFWFTPYTLAKVCAMSGFNIEKFQMCKQSKLSRWSVLNRFILKRYPALRDTIVMEVSF